MQIMLESTGRTKRQAKFSFRFAESSPALGFFRNH